jgi:hypothetical protein
MTGLMGCYTVRPYSVRQELADAHLYDKQATYRKDQAFENSFYVYND